jgi:aminopeptidase YwaD
LRCLVVAHYDTVYSSGGAYDNASGTTLAVLLARDLAVRGVDGVEVILLDGEEAGLWGAQHCLRRHQEDGLLGPSTIVLNIEGIGRGSQVEFWLAPEALDSKILPIAPALEQEGFAVCLRFPPPPASDHAVFWAAGYPVVMVTIDDQDVIHRPADRPHPAVLANMRRLYPHLLRLALLLSTAP